MIKYTLLSKWTVIGLTAASAICVYLAITQLNHVLFALMAVLIYGLAWVVALLDSVQEGRWFWAIGMFLMIPILVGPLLYSFWGPKNTR